MYDRCDAFNIFCALLHLPNSLLFMLFKVNYLPMMEIYKQSESSIKSCHKGLPLDNTHIKVY